MRVRTQQLCLRASCLWDKDGTSATREFWVRATTQVFGERLGSGALVGTAQVIANKRRTRRAEECSAVGRGGGRAGRPGVSAPVSQPSTAVCRSVPAYLRVLGPTSCA